MARQDDMDRPPAGGDSDIPSARGRVLAWVSLLCLAALGVVVVGFLLRHPLLLAGGIVGVVTSVAGGWWLITEQGVRRLAGAGALLLGVLVIVGSVVGAASRGDTRFWLLAVAGALLAGAIWSAREAVLDQLRRGAREGPRRVRPRHAVLICNPRSGGGKVERFGLVELADELGVEVVMLEPGLDLEQLATDAVARGADCLAMAGGDGSQALVAAIAARHDVPFVCVSAGTRNHFALDLGLDREDPRRGMAALREGVERRVDYATVGDRVFVNNVSLGVYATIVQQSGYREAKVETSTALLPDLLGRHDVPFDLQFTTPDGREVEGAFLVLVSNNPYVLGPALDVSQRRAMDTGQLGVLAVTAHSGGEAGRLVARAALGLGWRDPHLIRFETPSFVVRSRGGHAYAGVDGESLDLPTPLEFRTHPGGLRILVPEENLAEADRRHARSVSVRRLADQARGRSTPTHEPARR
jgi:diacylglycerol kinase family enzyme